MGKREGRTVDQPIVVHREEEDERPCNEGAYRRIPEERPEKVESGRVYHQQEQQAKHDLVLRLSLFLVLHQARAKAAHGIGGCMKQHWHDKERERQKKCN